MLQKDLVRFLGLILEKQFPCCKNHFHKDAISISSHLMRYLCNYLMDFQFQKPKILYPWVKSFYGLQQSSWAWYQRLNTTLRSHKFSRIEVDPNMYIKSFAKGHFIILVVYIDECIFVSNYLDLIFELKELLDKKFAMFHEGDINYCLGIQIIQNRKVSWVILLQEKYLIKVLHNFNMMNYILFLTPMKSNMKLSKDDIP